VKKSWAFGGVLLVLGVGGWLLYDNVFATTADDEFSLDAELADRSKGEPARTDSSGPAELAGSWTVADGSEAGYRLVEDTPVGERTVTARTSGVTGTVSLSETTLTATDITVDLLTVTSDQPLRDSAFRDSIVNTAEFPNAVFAQAESVTLAGLPAAGTPLTVEVPGTLSVNGVTKSISAKLDAVAAGTGSDTTITIVGTIDVVLTEFGINPPTIPNFITARDGATVEFKLQLTRG